MRALGSSIRVKIIVLVLVTIGLAQAASALLAGWQEAVRFGEERRNFLGSAGGVLATLTASAVVRGDRDAIADALKSVGRIKTLLYAAVQNTNGELLAESGEGVLLDSDLALGELSPAPTPSQLLGTRTMAMRLRVIAGGRQVGSVFLVADVSDAPRAVAGALATTATGSLVAFLLALALALRLQRSVTAPVRALTAATRSISADHDYSRVIPAQSRDEVGELVAAFNTMMGEVNERDGRLLAHQGRLERDVAERTQDFLAARDRAEHADQAKSAFLATMSHEIRTPMNGMLVMAELLVSSDLPARSRRYAEVIARSGQSLLAIINDILDLSKVEAGKLVVEQVPVSPAELARDVLDLFAERAASKGLDLAARVAIDTPSRILADPVRLNQVLSNLVNNALKFTSAGSIMLDIAPNDTRPNALCFRVIDTGIGIPQDKLASIFDAFSQAEESTTRQYGGTGLGLTICRKLVAAMHGELTVESEHGKGSIFGFTLACEGAEPADGWARTGLGRRARVELGGAATATAARYYLQAAGFTILDAGPDNTCGAAACDLAFLDSANAHLARPGTRTVLLAPMGDPMLDQADPPEGIAAVLTRPLTRSDIADLLAESGAVRRVHASATRDTETTLAGRIVLVVDDSAVNREVAAEALAVLGVRAEFAEDGLQAVEAVLASHYDVVLMDGSMPVLDGFKATRRIRATEVADGRSRLPIIALTAHVLGAAADEWRLAGMDRHLTKPFTVAGLRSCLEDVLAGRAIARTPVEDVTATVEHVLAAPSVIDPERLAEFASFRAIGRDDFVRRVVTLYLQHAPPALADMREHLAAGDGAALARAAHALKSMSLNIGATSVAAIAGRIEASASECTGVTELLIALTAALDDAQTVLQQLVNDDERIIAAA